MKEYFLDLIKGIYEKPTACIIRHGERLNALPTIWNETEIYAFASCYIVVEILPVKYGKKK